jgi:hypothetical protein
MDAEVHLLGNEKGELVDVRNPLRVEPLPEGLGEEVTTASGSLHLRGG